MDTGSSAFYIDLFSHGLFDDTGLGLFYGGLGRRKNVINTMMMSVLP